MGNQRKKERKKETKKSDGWQNGRVKVVVWPCGEAAEMMQNYDNLSLLQVKVTGITGYFLAVFYTNSPL